MTFHNNNILQTLASVHITPLISRANHGFFIDGDLVILVRLPALLIRSDGNVNLLQLSRVRALGICKTALVNFKLSMNDPGFGGIEVY